MIPEEHLQNVYKITGEPVDKMNVRDYEDMCPLWTQDEEVAKIFQHGKELHAQSQCLELKRSRKALKEGYKLLFHLIFSIGLL